MMPRELEYLMLVVFESVIKNMSTAIFTYEVSIPNFT
jgi:hypothetical protein